MVKVNLFIGIIFLIIGHEATAQFMGKIAADNFLYRVSSNKRQYYGQSMEDIKGSPYNENQFVLGDIYINNGKYTKIPLRYNIYDDKMEFQQNEVTYALEPDLRMRKISVGENVYVVDKFEFKWKEKVGYLLLLDSGKVSLMARLDVNFYERQEPRAMESAPTPAKFTRLSNTYYFKVSNQPVKKVESIKEMIASFPDKQVELNSFAKKEKISIKNEDELIKLVRYYNSLK